MGRKYCALYTGTVTHNDDPERLGRIRVRIPGVCEPASAWAFPLAAGGGASHVGAYCPPPVGADVGVLFQAGDVERPFYVGGWWGAPAAGSETPGPVGGYHGGEEEAEEVPAADAHLVRCWEGARFLVIVDERAGKERLVIRDKKTDDELLFDGVRYGVRLKATSILSLECDGVISLKGLQVNINGRTVMPNGQPIQ
jgi:hypothetical protein